MRAGVRRAAALVVAWTAGAMAVAACTVGPDYERPAAPEPLEYRAEEREGESIANTAWWDLYEDPVLQGLIEDGLENNRGLREAMARIAEARAAVGIARAVLYPSLSLVGAAFYQATPTDDSVSSFDNFKAAIGASYEVDLYGRVERSNEAAAQSLLATEEAYRTVTIGLVADIASTYLLLRDLDARLAIAEETVRLRREAVEIITVRVEGGLVRPVDVNRAQIELADALATVEILDRSIAQAENALSLLLGDLPSEIERGLALVDQGLPPVVPAGLPSELLQRRPDVLAAERLLHAQTARIGVAEAARWPSLSLTGALGVKSTALGEARSNNFFMNLGANVAGAIFDAGRRQSAVDVEIARAEQALNQYETAVLNAFREVEDALVAVETYRNEYQVRTEQLAAAQGALDVANVLYDEGLVDLMVVLDLQRSVFGTELRVSEVLQLHHTSVVQLYRALGGGWNPPEDEEGVAADAGEGQTAPVPDGAGP
jgi:multidrug efflux system outer membrane protein